MKRNTKILVVGIIAAVVIAAAFGIGSKKEPANKVICIDEKGEVTKDFTCNTNSDCAFLYGWDKAYGEFIDEHCPPETMSMNMPLCITEFLCQDGYCMVRCTSMP